MSSLCSDRAGAESQSSHTRPRQSGGIIPSRSALAIMPRWRKSARSTWQRRQSVRRLARALVPRFPLLMWSMWQTLSATGAPQCVQQPPSRSHTMTRSAAQISRGGRFFGNPYLTVPRQSLPLRTQPEQTVPSPSTPGHVVVSSESKRSRSKALTSPCSTAPYRAKPCLHHGIPSPTEADRATMSFRGCRNVALARNEPLPQLAAPYQNEPYLALARQT